MNNTKRKLPADIKENYRPIETINRADQPYTAKPHFVQYPDNHLHDWSFTQEVTAKDGTKWLVRTYSPRQFQRGEKWIGEYDIIYCQVV